MCDTGILESHPDSMKLEYCIEIPATIWKEMEAKISELIGESVKIISPKEGQYPPDLPEHSRNTVEICTVNSPDHPYLNQVVNFSLKELPGCCGVLISYHVRVAKRFQNKGINSYLQEVRERIARHNNYTTLMCTTTKDNKAEIHILEKYGWNMVHSFKNKRTGNVVLTYIKVLE